MADFPVPLPIGIPGLEEGGDRGEQMGVFDAWGGLMATPALGAGAGAHVGAEGHEGCHSSPPGMG